jgi:hypothetical protein
MLRNSGFCQGIQVDLVSDTIDSQPQIVLQDCHKVEAALLKHTIILNPLLLLQLKLGEELFVVLFKRLNLQEKISDKLNALHVGLGHLHLLIVIVFLVIILNYLAKKFFNCRILLSFIIIGLRRGLIG